MGSIAEYLPRDYAVTSRIQEMIHGIKSRPAHSLDPTVTAMKDMLENDESLTALCDSMFVQARELIHAGRAESTYLAIDSIEVLMQLFDYILIRAPEFEDHVVPDNLGGLPFNLILMVLMETPSGLQLFQHVGVNQHLKKILQKWAVFLESPDSLYALNPRDGWLSYPAITKLEAVANKATGECIKFVDIYDCPEPDNPDTLGFSCWDEFFRRKLKADARPLPTREALNDGGDERSAILNACESKPWAIVRSCSSSTAITLKSKSYSIHSMLGNDPLAEPFVNGTVYQAYLSSLSYHRWHSPVSGVVRKVLYLDGSYFSQLPMSDILAMEKSQSYLATVATRAAIFIDSWDPRVGLICFVAVGMGEVSSCEAFVQQGDFLQAGDEMGCFHYGGSTHCLLFQEGVDVQFEAHVEDATRGHNIPVRSLLARC